MARPPDYESNEELIELGEDILKWIQDTWNDDRIVHLSQYYIPKGYCRSSWKNIIQRQAFLPYYEQVIEALGTKMLTNSKFPQSYGNRFLPVYFKDIRESEREIQREKISDEIELKRNTQDALSPEAVALNKAIVEGISKLQEKKE